MWGKHYEDRIIAPPAPPRTNINTSKWYGYKTFKILKGDNKMSQYAHIPTQTQQYSDGTTNDIYMGLAMAEERGKSPLEVQIGGDHYKKYKIQPVEFNHANKLDFFQGEVIKYITRFRDKNGKVDLEKARHVIDLLISLEYPD